MNWFVEFLNLTADHWATEAERFMARSQAALVDGNLWDAAHNAGAASECRRISQSFRRSEAMLRIGDPEQPATEDHDYDCTIADLVDFTSGEAYQ